MQWSVTVPAGNSARRFARRGVWDADRVLRRILLRAAAALVFVTALAGGAAPAAEPVPADPWEIIHVAREFGPAQVGRDGLRDPQIEATTGGLHYRVVFYGCYLGRDCDTILFDARFTRKDWARNPPRPDIFAAWNREKLIGRAWLDREGRAVLDWPMVLGDGVPEETLRAAFSRWRTALGEFAEHLGIR